MQVSAKGRYGLRALFELALSQGQGPVLIRDIAVKQAIPEAYLEQIFLILRKAGLVKSVRGAYGGYLLAREPEKVSIKEILNILEGEERIVPCLDQPLACSLFSTCVLKEFWQDLEETQREFLTGTSLADLVNRKKQQEQELVPPNYHI